MKLLITLKSFSKNKTLVNSIKTGLYTGIVVAIPVFFLIFYLVAKVNDRTLLQINTSQQELLLKNFENAARYGDLVNAKELVIQQGKSLGLVNFYLCDSKLNEILATYIKNDCSYTNANEPIYIGGNPIYAKFQWKKEELNFYEIAAFSLILSTLLSIPILLIGNYFTYRTIIKTVKIYSDQLAKSALSIDHVNNDIDLKEFKPLLSSIDRLKNQIIEGANKLNEQRLNEAIILQAKQVAHDIRSPLSVLNLLIPTYQSIELDERSQMISTSLKRVNEIAEDLLNKNTTNKFLQSHEISETLNFIVKEKIIEINNKKNITIHLNNNLNANSSSRIKKSDLSRIISNLINNSIDAIEDEGIVQINAYSYYNLTKIEISDNGKGIPVAILHKVGTEGFSYKKTSKNSGHGMGVFHAKQTIESIGGSLEIKSTLDHGTIIIMTI